MNYDNKEIFIRVYIKRKQVKIKILFKKNGFFIGFKVEHKFFWFLILIKIV